MTTKVNPEFVNYTVEKLKQIADSMTETEEGIAFGIELLRLQASRSRASGCPLRRLFRFRRREFQEGCSRVL